MILFLDIENTIIDNLTDCNWLEENCKKIKDFIFTKGIDTVHIYTWGWKTNKEINQEILNNIYKKLDIDEEQIGYCITKEKSVDYCINGGFIPANEKERALIPGMMKSDYSLDKTFVFLFMTRPDRQEGAVYYLIDDTTETNLTGNENAFTINPTDL